MAEQRTKEVIQKEAFAAWKKAGEHGLIGNCTRSGKSRIAVMAAQELYEKAEQEGKLKDLKVLLVTYTVTSGKTDWPNEFKAWGQERILKHVYHVCYASLGNIIKEEYDLVILDEAHHLTWKSYQFFVENPQPRIMMLTATAPDEDKEAYKSVLLKALGPLVYAYKLDQAVADKNVADYRLWIVDMELDDTVKYVKAGSKTKPFLTTEKAQYDYMTRAMAKAYGADDPEWADIIVKKRMWFLAKLRSLERVAKKILARIPKEARTLIFASSIEQSANLCDHAYHSKTGPEDLEAFRAEEINRIVSVKALNEAVTLSNIDYVVIVLANSMARDMIQRIGRGLGYRPGYVANIFIIRIIGTVSEQWVADALKDMDQSKIRYYPASNFNR